MSEREVVVILSFERMPQGDWPQMEADEIKRLLGKTDPATIQGAGQTYQYASTKIEQAVNSLEEHAAKIVQVWKGPDAAKARHALEMLHASGRELSTKLNLMAGALNTYAGHLTTAKSKASEEVTVPGANQMSSAEEKVVRDGLEKVQAQRALWELNKQIVSLYNIEVPHDVSYELPTVTIPPPAETKKVDYPDGSGTTGPTFRSVGDTGSGSGYGGSGSGSSGSGSGSGSGGSGSGGSGSGGSGSSGSGSGGSGSGGSGSGGSGGPGDSGGSNPGGTDPGGSTPPDPNNPGAPGTQDPGQTQNPGQNSGSGTGDGTVPPVIGGEDRTTTGGSDGLDPRRTDMAGFQPQTGTLTPSLGTLPSTTTISPPPSVSLTPVGTTPIGGTPGVPSVIGSPGLVAGQSPLGAAGARGAGGMSSGMPLMPFTGGAGGAGEHGDLERSTFLTEDASAWTTGHDTTEPVIG
ncbi:WXG100 family type VII secretion target [Nonomuraea sp. NPDC050783]|uniref:WXG100 family type VII secretion target n=1 Tax=Nonomuraea sp. NPDC050783 TaxID=3154634 RepID=UPI003466C42F